MKKIKLAIFWRGAGTYSVLAFRGDKRENGSTLQEDNECIWKKSVMAISQEDLNEQLKPIYEKLKEEYKNNNQYGDIVFGHSRYRAIKYRSEK